MPFIDRDIVRADGVPLPLTLICHAIEGQGHVQKTRKRANDRRETRERKDAIVGVRCVCNRGLMAYPAQNPAYPAPQARAYTAVSLPPLPHTHTRECIYRACIVGNSVSPENGTRPTLIPLLPHSLLGAPQRTPPASSHYPVVLAMPKLTMLSRLRVLDAR